jgi:hypothetical protein
MSSGAYGFSPDTASYLNLARQLRGIPLESSWDFVANLPRDDQGARTPGYPILLDLVFWADRYAPSPRWMIERASQYKINAFNLHFMQTEENLRAVQLVQVMSGLLATWLTYATTLRWTGRRSLAAVTALVAVAVRPSWAVVYEPWLVSEATAALVVLLWVWTMTRAEQDRERRAWWLVVASVLSAAAVLVRPAMIVMPVLFAAGALWMSDDRRLHRVALLCLPCALLLGGWIARNAIRYGAPAVSTELGVTILSHFSSHPEALNDTRVRSAAAGHRGDPMAGLWIARTLMIEDGLSFPAASHLLTQQTFRAAIHHPIWYLTSVSGALSEFMRPTETMITPGDVPGFSKLTRMIDERLPRVAWRGYLSAYFAIGLLGLVSLFMRTPVSTRIAVLVVVLSAIVTSLLAHTENGRFAFPCETLSLMSAAVVVARVVARRPRRSAAHSSLMPSSGGTR